MLEILNKISVKTDAKNSKLTINFEGHTELSIYDVCDLNGRILKTGRIPSDITDIDISDLDSGTYLLLILDGDRMFSQRFKLA